MNGSIQEQLNMNLNNAPLCFSLPHFWAVLLHELLDIYMGRFHGLVFRATNLEIKARLLPRADLLNVGMVFFCSISPAEQNKPHKLALAFK